MGTKSLWRSGGKGKTGRAVTMIQRGGTAGGALLGSERTKVPQSSEVPFKHLPLFFFLKSVP